jgi:hypothetical protein
MQRLSLACSSLHVVVGAGGSTSSQPSLRREEKTQRLPFALSFLPVFAGAGSSTIAEPKHSEPVPSVHRLFVPIAEKRGVLARLSRG